MPPLVLRCRHPTPLLLLCRLQNDFLRPFVVVMRHSRSVEIRELIIRCVSQMVLARVANVKSGWKSMFMVSRMCSVTAGSVLLGSLLLGWAAVADARRRQGGSCRWFAQPWDR